ncbi:MAG: hypothetical protein OEZ34_01165, partial [Spirochaetia bacterium]|nr:hypothetical protein [Spirochaetia bacterium]
MKLKQFFLDTLILKLKKPPYRLAGHELSLKQIFLIIGIVTTVEIFLFSSIGIWTYNTRFRINEAVLITPFLALFLCGLLFLFYMIAKFFENASNLFNLTVILLSGFTFV